jgi:CRP-like cAMP-binding protein
VKDPGIAQGDLIKMDRGVGTDPFENIVPFVFVAEAKSFAIAARRLGVSPSSVSRAIARLETSVGVRLLLRKRAGRLNNGLVQDRLVRLGAAAQRIVR